MTAPTRPPVGRLNGITAEVGTVLGPDTAGQWFAVVGCDSGGVDVGYATTDEMDAVATREPRSVAEHGLQVAARRLLAATQAGGTVSDARRPAPVGRRA